MNKEKNLVWIDLEMTGLEVSQHVIIEIATIITDGQLKEIAQGPHLVIHYPQEQLANMNDWVKKVHGKSGLLDEVAQSKVTLAQAEKQTLDFIKEYCIEKKALLAGNSVWNDRIFLEKYMPSIIDFLNYRLVDVTSIKEVLARWYEGDERVFFKKSDTHRALQDIRESIEELKNYREYFFI